jgi:excisionase family DNA binding protein
MPVAPNSSFAKPIGIDLLKLWVTVHHKAIQSHVDRIVGQLREGITKAISEELAAFKTSQTRIGSGSSLPPSPPAGVSLSDQERVKAVDLRTALLLGEVPDDAGLLIDVKTATRLLNVSSRTLYLLHDLGMTPSPVRIGRLVRFRLAELLAWIEADCPPKKHWSYSPDSQPTKRRK